MKDSTKKMLAGLAEAGADYIARQAKHYSKNNKLPDEYRDQYAEVADRFSSLRASIHDSRESIGTQRAISESTSLMGGEDDLDDETEASAFSSPKATIKKTYFNDKKSDEQTLCATSNDNIGGLSVEEWDQKWLACGRLCSVRFDKIPEDVIGIIRLRCNDKVVYIIRAVELGHGGIRKKVADLSDVSKKKKSLVFHKIKENSNLIDFDILPIGTNESAINICRNLERALISKYTPLWI